MVKRSISPVQANHLINHLKEFSPGIEDRIQRHKKYLESKEHRDVEDDYVRRDYLKYHLGDFCKGVADAYFEFVPKGEFEAPMVDGSPCIKNDGSSYLDKEIIEMKKEIKANMYHMEKRIHRKPTFQESENDWIPESYKFGAGFGYGACKFGCPNRGNCKDRAGKLEKALESRDEK